jgi:hypothetical protein
MLKVASVVAALALLSGAITPAEAGPRFKTLGTDPAGDAPPALDLTYLKVGQAALKTDEGLKRAFEIRIGVEGMLPELGGYPDVPGIEWVFKIADRVFIAEGVAGRTPRFFLFEMTPDGFEQLESPFGTYDWEDGFIRIVVPLELVGARRGSVVTGEVVDELGADGDVDAHLHIGPETYYADAFKTSGRFVIP